MRREYLNKLREYSVNGKESNKAIKLGDMVLVYFIKAVFLKFYLVHS